MNIQHKANDLADALNAKCACMTLDRDRLIETLYTDAEVGTLWTDLAVTHPHLFAATPAFISSEILNKMTRVVETIERLAKSNEFQQTALAQAPRIAQHDFGPVGALMGYDFDVTPTGPKLIEINTNAGGAFLNAALREAQRACCVEVKDRFLKPQSPTFENLACSMFEQEFHLQKPAAKLHSIAIVDDAPEQQYLYPEFILANAVLTKAGYSVVICDPSDLNFDGHSLSYKSKTIDLVYNRLVDFMFGEQSHAALRAAYGSGAVVVTPNPHIHALLANKRNLVDLSNPEMLKSMGASTEDLETLTAIPRTRMVTPENAETLWTERKNLFFKPLSGHGGKAVYRGNKLTLSTWSAIRQQYYIAQDVAKPGERTIKGLDAKGPHKMDVRLYTYAGEVLLKAARIYQGQTTNFRTPGGGFSPLFAVG